MTHNKAHYLRALADWLEPQDMIMHVLDSKPKLIADLRRWADEAEAEIDLQQLINQVYNEASRNGPHCGTEIRHLLERSGAVTVEEE